MASITIRHLDDDAKTRLRVRTAGNGRSMEEEARLILRRAVERKNAPAISRPPIAPGSRLSAEWSWIRPSADRCANRPPSNEAAAMFLLDTNLVSELLRPSLDPSVEKD